MDPGQLERFEKKYRVDPGTGCWLWTAATNGLGYGQMGIGNKRLGLAHRLSYEHFIGPIPDGMWIDHLCRVPGCCNPIHLEAVTPRENLRRAGVVDREVCRRGHPLTKDNLYVHSSGKRMCRKCMAVRQKKPA